MPVSKIFMAFVNEWAHVFVVHTVINKKVLDVKNVRKYTFSLMQAIN